MAKGKPPKRLKASQPSDDHEGRDIREAPDDPHRLAHFYLRFSAVEAKSRWALTFWRGEWWVWEGQRYRTLADADVAAQLTAAIKWEFDRLATALGKRKKGNTKSRFIAKVTRPLVGNVSQALKSIVLIPTNLDQPSWIGDGPNRGKVIAVENGLLDVDALLAGRDDVLTAHSSKWFSPVCLPYAWNRDASCPQFQRFLQEVLEGDAERINLLQEWFGLCLFGDTSFQKFLILLGEGSNGKTVALTVLTRMLGEENVSHVLIEVFGRQFQLMPTLGKLANIVSEIGDGDRVDEAVLKAFVAGEPIHIDRKHLSPIHATATARLIAATNNLPAFADRSSGLWRRMIILPFRVAIPPSHQDRQLTNKLLAELPGIFNWAVEGWRRLQTQERFTEPAVCRETLEENRVSANPARAFLADEMRYCPNASTPCQDVYREYRTWCQQAGHRALNDGQLGKEIVRMYPKVTRGRANGSRQSPRPWMYRGLEFAERVAAPFPAPVPQRRRSGNTASTVSRVS
jgi:putative DNA primase/helicase